MKMKTTSLIICLLLCGCEKPQRHDAWLDAESDIQEQLTNDVVGYSRTINMFVDRQKTDPLKWTADVTVEYVNHQGGIDRTNLFYRCINTNGVWVQAEKPEPLRPNPGNSY